MTQIILLTGPTASGKSSKAVELAKKYNGCIINADSMQVYKGIEIISAQPNDEERQGINHFMYGHLDCIERYSLGRFLQDVKNTIITNKFDVNIIVGGTAMYIRAIIDGVSSIPLIDQDTKSRALDVVSNDINKAYDIITQNDNTLKDKINKTDTQRITRCLEVLMQTGESISTFWNIGNINIFSDFNIKKLLIMPERELLYNNINKRFNTMINSGVLDEVKRFRQLPNYESFTAYKASGMRQLIDFLDGRISKDLAIEKAKQETRRYAKRQLTWFRNNFQDFQLL